MIFFASSLAFAAGCTERITLGTLVTGVHYRHPGLLVKTVTTLDVLSGGRAWLGIGAGWNEAESRGLGVPFPSTSERFERLDETLQICHQMWRGDETPFVGNHYQLERPLNVPQSLSRPHPRIVVGGSGGSSQVSGRLGRSSELGPTTCSLGCASCAEDVPASGARMRRFMISSFGNRAGAHPRERRSAFRPFLRHDPVTPR